jgi:hypothetical protein
MTLGALLPKNVNASQRKKAIDKIRLLEAQPPQVSSVCFVGSSTFTFWTKLTEDMRPYCGNVSVFNAAFGGSCSDHVLEFAEQLVFRWKPKVIVYFCGTNDYNLQRSVYDCQHSCCSAVLNFERFVMQARSFLPGVRVVYLAPVITPFVTMRGPAILQRFIQGNNDARAFCHAQVDVEYVGSHPFQSQVRYYLGDMHHLNNEGHSQLANLLAPAVQRALSIQ